MEFKSPSGKHYKFTFLNNDLLCHFKANSIPLHHCGNLTELSKKLTYSELAFLLKFQYMVALKMGVQFVDPNILFNPGYHFDAYSAGMIKEAFNAIDSEALLNIYSECSQFNVIDAGSNVILVLFNQQNQCDIPGWDVLQAKTFSGALLESLFAKVGYMDCHLGKIPKIQSGSFTMAEVYKLVNIENP